VIKIRVSDLLGSRKMTQRELSRRTGIRPATISALYHETAKRIELAHIEALCRALDCQPADLIQLIPE
jgi:putative transcriptional regulator